MLWHNHFGRVRTCNDMWVGPSGKMYGTFVDRYGTIVSLPLDEVTIW